ncbi:hypothetical protein [Actinosynnema sp.]|uniref:hypothetical protein n=1 Tax=Actinosynnema sp. TaxID=1872144 RepID=UPI003F84EB73
MKSAILRAVFGQQGCRVRLEWGGEGVSALGGECAVLVVVDVLSFSTAVPSQGAFPCDGRPPCS